MNQEVVHLLLQTETKSRLHMKILKTIEQLDIIIRAVYRNAKCTGRQNETQNCINRKIFSGMGF